MKALLAELAVLLDEVMQDVQAHRWIANAPDQGGHGTRKERNGEEKLFLGRPERLERHLPFAQRAQVRVVENPGARDDLTGSRSHLGRARGRERHSSDLRG